MSNLTTVNSNENAILIKAEIDLQITTAKSYPRDIKKALDNAKKTVRMSQKIAESCIYSVPRKKKNDKTDEYETVLIEGASVRLAEIMATCYGNIHAATRVLEGDGRSITAQAVVWDLESNFKLTEEVKKSILKNNGQPCSEDIINLTSNAARSKALRNALLKVIPRSLVEEVYAEAEKVIVGEEKDFPERKKKMVEQFQKINFPVENVLKYIKKKSLDEITPQDMPILTGIFNAKKDGAFDEESQQKTSKTSKLNEELIKNDSEAIKKDKESNDWVAQFDNTESL